MTLRTITFDDEKWAVVPREPTRKMLEAKMRTFGDDPNAMSGDTDLLTMVYDKECNEYYALLATSPKPEAQENEE